MMKASTSHPPVFLQTGFRIFFLAAAAYAVVSMLFWKIFYVAGGNIFVTMPLTVWHGHEMVFGFTMAVVAGFLLTAVMNWTGLPTLNGLPLFGLFLIWLLGRIFAFMPASFPLWPLALCDSLFMIFLIGAVMKPIIAVKQWNQSAVFSKLILLWAAVLALHAGLFMSNLNAERKALRFAVYMVVSLVFTIGRRIMPFFIERGVGYPVTLRNSRVLDILSLVLLIAFSVLDIFWPQKNLIAFLCAALVIVHSLRLAGWHTPGIWKKPLLWILFLGYIFLICGFVLKFFAVLAQRPDDSAMHAFTAGGIGLFTLGMMARVAWGHTGRNVGQPPAQLPWIFIPMVASAFVRVFFPMIYEPKYILWIAFSQILWMVAFGLYLIVYFKVLISARPDGKWG